MENYKSILGRNIRNLRKKLNLTQEAFSEALDLSPQFLSTLERGLCCISLPTAIRICNVCHCSANDLFLDIIEQPAILENYLRLSIHDRAIIDVIIKTLIEKK